MSKVHWRDLLIGAAGVWLIASRFVLGYDLDDTAAANSYVVGFGLIIFSLISAWQFSGAQRMVVLGEAAVTVVDESDAPMML